METGKIKPAKSGKMKPALTAMDMTHVDCGLDG